MPKASRAERVVLDTSAWVSLLNDYPDRAEHVERLLERAERREIQIYVSAITIAEITKGPTAADLPITEDQRETFERYLEHPFVTLVSLDPVVARRAGDLRVRYHHLKTPDAVILATALVTNATTLYTYDKRDLLRLNADEGLPNLAIVEPPVEHQTVLPLE